MKKTNKHRYNLSNIRDCPLFKLLISQFLPSTLSRNHYLEQSFARILRDNEIPIEAVADLVSEMDIAQRKNVQVDPDYLGDADIFNSEMVNSYCIASNIDLIYPLLEDIPDVTEDYITEEHYQQLNNYSEKTMLKMIIKDFEYIQPDSYLDLKKLIRNLCDRYAKATVFFTIKALYIEDWDYYHKNRIILQLLNKTRKRID